MWKYTQQINIIYVDKNIKFNSIDIKSNEEAQDMNQVIVYIFVFI